MKYVKYSLILLVAILANIKIANATSQNGRALLFFGS